MKIIGEHPHGFIVFASKSELEQVCGSQTNGLRFVVGDILRVHEAWKQLQALAGYQPQAGEAAAQLRALADLLTVEPKISAGSDEVP